MNHLLETTMLFTVAGEEIEVALAIWFTFQRGYPATHMEPGEDDAVEIAEVYVGMGDESKQNACPPWLWNALIDNTALQEEMLAVVADHHAEAAEYRAEARREARWSEAA